MTTNISVGGGATGGTYTTALTAAQASLATSILTSFRKSDVNTASVDTLTPGGHHVLLATKASGSTGISLTDLNSGSVVVGNTGNDTLTAGLAGSIVGGDGNNMVSLTSGVVYLGGGNDTVISASSASVSAGNGADNISVTGAANVTVGNGNDTIFVGSGSVSVGFGNDSITAGSGNTTITQVGIGGGDTVNLGSGNSSITVAAQATVTGASGYSAVMWHGATLAQSVSGGQTTVTGSGEQISITGGANEMLVGSNGAYLYASATGDTLQAAAGSVNLLGGAGTDVFSFSTTSSAVTATVKGFTHGSDTVHIAGLTGAQLLAGTKASGNYISYTNGNATIHLNNGSTIVVVGSGHLLTGDFS